MQMATFYVRLDVHNITPEESQLLYVSLTAVKFYRFFLSKNKSYWQLPSGFYRTEAESLATVSSRIKSVLKRLNKSGEYVIVASEAMTTFGLKPISRTEAILLNEGAT